MPRDVRRYAHHIWTCTSSHTRTAERTGTRPGFWIASVVGRQSSCTRASGVYFDAGRGITLPGSISFALPRWPAYVQMCRSHHSALHRSW